MTLRFPIGNFGEIYVANEVHGILKEFAKKHEDYISYESRQEYLITKLKKKEKLKDIIFLELEINELFLNIRREFIDETMKNE